MTNYAHGKNKLRNMMLRNGKKIVYEEFDSDDESQFDLNYDGFKSPNMVLKGIDKIFKLFMIYLGMLGMFSNMIITGYVGIYLMYFVTGLLYSGVYFAYIFFTMVAVYLYKAVEGNLDNWLKTQDFSEFEIHSF